MSVKYYVTFDMFNSFNVMLKGTVNPPKPEGKKTR